jgi:hypothetical protein
MEFLILLLPLLSIGFWIYAERHRGLAIRLVTGIANLLLVGYACSAFANIIHRYESTAHRSSLRLAEKLIETDQTQRVREAIQAYNRTTKTGNTYAAAMEMWQVLNHGPKI